MINTQKLLKKNAIYIVDEFFDKVSDFMETHISLKDNDKFLEIVLGYLNQKIDELNYNK